MFLKFKKDFSSGYFSNKCQFFTLFNKFTVKIILNWIL